jgi:hypothetical protein
MRWLLLALFACSSPSKPVLENTAKPDPTKPAVVIVQLAYRGTFGIGPPFSSPPPFTLLDDGTFIGSKDAAIYTAKLSHDETDRIVQHVRELGFERLKDHKDSCKRNPDGTGMCVSDASYTILRVLLPSGKLHEVTSYAGFSNEPETLEKIVQYLETYKPAKTSPYRPTFGALHVQVDTKPPKPPCTAIDPAIVQFDKATQTMWVRRIDGAAVDTVLAFAKDREWFDACANGALFHLMFIPGVPGADLSEELDVYKR